MHSTFIIFLIFFLAVLSPWQASGCGTNCVTCGSDGKCTQCQPNNSLNISTAYLDCSPCNFLKCLTCTDGPQCSSCTVGYYLDSFSKKCQPCQYPCVECTSYSNCLKCPSNQLYYLKTTTTPNQCKYCIDKLNNCLKCDHSGSICKACISNYFYLDSTNNCVNCPNPCKQCLSQSQCLTCINTNYALQTSSNQCVTCATVIPRCATCLSQTLCLTCDTSATYFLTYPPKRCVTCQQAHQNCQTCVDIPLFGPGCSQCFPHYFIDNHACFKCPPVCSACTDLNTCTACMSTTYGLRNGVCELCSILIPGCTKCSSDTVCINCQDNSEMIGGVCTPCLLADYFDRTSRTCQSCVSPCLTCLNMKDCLTCLQFYDYNPLAKRCQDFCGDSVVITDQCDNSKGIQNDGCSDTCQQQTNFTCVKYPQILSGQSIFKSICSYNQIVNINLISIRKEPFKNSLTWIYTIIPYLYGLPGTTTRSFTQQELKNIFSFYDVVYGPSTAASHLKTHATVSGLMIIQIIANPINSQVSITFTYDRDIKKQELALFIDFNYLKTVLGISNFDSTPNSQKVIRVSAYRSDSMIGQFYTEEQYSKAITLNKVALAVGLMSFLAFIISIFTKELVGLEMAMLCQFTYISLFYFEGTLYLPLFALKQLIYATGYNIPSQAQGYTYELINFNPPQSITLNFDARTLSHNFNLMALLYVLPLIFVSPFVLLKAKCIRKFSIFEFGSKWADLLLGEIMFYVVMFNLQYFLFGLVVFFQDGRNLQDYLSLMIVCFGGICTVVSLLGIVLRPQIYGNFRTSFKYDTQLRWQVIQKELSRVNQEISFENRFQNNCSLSKCKRLLTYFNVFINQNYIYRNYQKIYNILSFNYFPITGIFYLLIILALTLIKKSQIIVIGLTSAILLLIIMLRPYGRVSQKIRGIVFGSIYLTLSLIRYFHNNMIKDEYSLKQPFVILLLLLFALVWTFIVLIKHLIESLIQGLQKRNLIVKKVFNQDLVDDMEKKSELQQEHENLIKKLMMRYERVQLQQNLFNIRNQLLSEGEYFLHRYLPQSDIYFQKSPQKLQNKLVPEKILKKMEEENDFKDLKVQIIKEKKSKKKQLMKDRISHEKMLRLLKLDNFTKYEQEYLIDDGSQKNKKKINEQIQENNIDINQQFFSPKQRQEEPNSIQNQNSEQSKGKHQDSQNSQIQQIQGALEYKSIEPQTFEEAKEKLKQENVLVEQSQYLRYLRAKKVIIRDGLEVDHSLIVENFDNI